MANSLTIQAAGQTIAVTIADERGSATTRCSVGGSPVTFPNTITTDTTYVFSGGGKYTISCIIDTVETYGKTHLFRNSENTTIAPTMTLAQLAVNSGGGGGTGLPSQTGAARKVLTSDGATASFGNFVPVFYAADYGVVADFTFPTGTDNTTALRNCLTAAAAYTTSNQRGAIVQLPAGSIRITDTITVQYGVWLRGAGVGATELYGYVTGSNSNPVVKMDNTAQAATISDLTINGWTIGTSSSHGIQMDGVSAAYKGSGGAPNLIERVFVVGAKGDGINMAGLEARLVDCYVARAAGSGINLTSGGSDCFVTGCTADTNGAQGFSCQSPNTKFASCKAFGNTNNGFNMGTVRCLLANCEAQDNGDAGFNLTGGGNVAAGCVADSNGLNGGTQYGFVLNADSSCSGCLAVNRNGTTQTYGYFGQIANGDNPPTIHGNSEVPGLGHIAPSTQATVSVNGLGGAQSIAYAATITPNPYLGGTVIVGTLTGAITVNAPVQGIWLNAAASLTPFKGMVMRFQLTQDATGGRVVTWNAAYKPASAIGTAANSVTVITFSYDGTSWQEVSRTGGAGLVAANNLSDLASATTARTNLGLGTAAVAAGPSGTIVGTTDTQTLTNKRRTARVTTVTQSATPALNTDNMDVASITGLAQAITSMTTSLTGTPNAGDMLIIEITDNGTARAITWGASFASTTVTLPTTTVISTLLRVGFRRDAGNTAWSCVAVA